VPDIDITVQECDATEFKQQQYSRVHKERKHIAGVLMICSGILDL